MRTCPEYRRVVLFLPDHPPHVEEDGPAAGDAASAGQAARSRQRLVLVPTKPNEVRR